MSFAFDETYYLQQNPDVLQAITQGLIASAQFHYDNFGWRELRDPNSSFDTSFYLTANTDVLAAGVNPLNHFVESGASEGRVPNATINTALGSPAAGGGDDAFDDAAYLAANPDVQAALTAGTITSGYQHWILFGQFESREGAQTTTGTDLSNTGGNTGTTFTLTTDVDGPAPSGDGINTNGTDANDTYNATSGTLNTFDSIDGAGGTDRLDLIITDDGVGTSAYTAAPTVSNVENLFIRNLDAGGAAALTTFSGVEQVWSDRSTQTLTVTDIQSLATIGAVNTDADFAVGFDTTLLSGSSDTVNVVLNGVDDSATGAAAVLIDVDEGNNDGIEALSINLTGAASGGNSGVQVAGGDDVETVTITGTVAGDLDLVVGNAGDDIKTVTATDASGGVKVDVRGSTEDMTVNMGSGNDTVRVRASDFDRNDDLDGGDGTDTFRIGLDGNVSAGTTGLQITNFEILRIDDTDNSGTIDMEDVAGITTVRVSESDDSTETSTVNNLVQTATAFVFSGDGEDAAQQFDGLDVDYDGTSALSETTVAISNGGTEAKSVTIGGIDAANVEKLTVTATDVGTATGEALALGTLAGADLTSIAVTSNSDVSATINAAKVATADFSGSDAGIELNVTGVAAGFEATLGDGNDIYDAAVATEVTGGSGSDRFELNGAAGGATTTITDFAVGSGGDALADLAADDGGGNALTQREVVSDGDTFAATTGFAIYDGNDLATGDAAGFEDLFDGTTANLQLNGFGNAGETVYLAASNGTDTFLAVIENDGTANAEAAAAEITIIGVLEGIDDATAITASNLDNFL